VVWRSVTPPQRLRRGAARVRSTIVCCVDNDAYDGDAGELVIVDNGDGDAGVVSVPPHFEIP
jgi:hypothetical protein